MLDKLEAIHSRFLDLEEKLSDPSVVSDMKEYTRLNKAYKDLGEINSCYLTYKNILENIDSSKEMLKDEDVLHDSPRLRGLG